MWLRLLVWFKWWVGVRVVKAYRVGPSHVTCLPLEHTWLVMAEVVRDDVLGVPVKLLQLGFAQSAQSDWWWQWIRIELELSLWVAYISFFSLIFECITPADKLSLVLYLLFDRRVLVVDLHWDSPLSMFRLLLLSPFSFLSDRIEAAWQPDSTFSHLQFHIVVIEMRYGFQVAILLLNARYGDAHVISPPWRPDSDQLLVLVVRVII